jgi:predicted ATPase
MLEWRFYHDLRTDPASPLRRPSLAVASPTLESDGGNLAAVLATLVHLRQDTDALDRAVDDAFADARLEVPVPGRAASFGLVFPEHPRRAFDAAELSDGTLRYLAPAGALLSFRLPPFIALNEPEASLHPELLEPLARLVAAASLRTQIWLVTHSERLAGALEHVASARPRRMIKEEGETVIEDEGLSFQRPAKRAR